VAIEEGRYNALPGDVYVKGFIRNYAEYLGLNGSQLVSLYNDSLRPINAAAFPSAVHINVVKSNKFSIRLLIRSIFVITMLVIAGWTLYSWQLSSPGNFQQPQGSVAKTQEYPAFVPVGAESSASQIHSATKKPVILTAAFIDRCWTSVTADGIPVYQGIPRIGAIFTWEADRLIVVHLGNAGAVDLTLNGQRIGKAGERGDVVVKTFSAPAGQVIR